VLELALDELRHQSRKCEKFTDMEYG
jgi:hypothetical protein